MGGGLMQLVAYGAQDIYLTGNPQITFFKVVYRRHTNFSMESIKQTFNGTADFGSSASATISRNGDLVYRMYLEHNATFTHTAGAATPADHLDVGHVERYGDSLIKECEIEIGGQKIDKHTSMWNRVYSDLTQFNPSGHFGSTVAPGEANPASGSGTLYQRMTGNGYGLNTEVHAATNVDFGVGDATDVNGFDYLTADTDAGAKITVNNIFIPLNFWFNRNPGLALPLIALQYHEVKVKMTFENLNKLVLQSVSSGGFDAEVNPATTSTVTVTKNFDLWCDYIYLDTDERRRFAQVSHEYLIEQLQYSENTLNTQTPSIDLNFNHPVKELIWTTRNETSGAAAGRCQSINAGTSGDLTAGPVSLDTMGGKWQLKLNGHDRFKERDTKYFTRTQVWEHHTGYGAVPTHGQTLQNVEPATAEGALVGNDSIAVYSFALKPEEHQPSGTCNFSRIDNAQLVGSGVQVAAGSGGALASATDSTANESKLTIFAVNYNVLRIMSGMGGLAYSN
jgi:hypothetical protein